MEELKACPFCGGEAKIINDNGFMVKCKQCLANHGWWTREKATKNWNTRTQPEVLAEAQWELRFKRSDYLAKRFIELHEDMSELLLLNYGQIDELIKAEVK